MTSYFAPNMQSPLCVEICGMREFGRAKVPQMLFYTQHADLRSVGFVRAVVSYAKKTGRVIYTRATLILRVDTVGYFAQVQNTIVTFVAVSMIDESSGPVVVHVQPGKSVRSIRHIIYADNAIACVVTAGDNTGKQAPATYTPDENTGFGVVVQQLAQAIRSQWDNIFAHAACPPDKGVGSYPRGLPAPWVAPLYAEVA